MTEPAGPLLKSELANAIACCFCNCRQVEMLAGAASGLCVCCDETQNVTNKCRLGHRKLVNRAGPLHLHDDARSRSARITMEKMQNLTLHYMLRALRPILRSGKHSTNRVHLRNRPDIWYVTWLHTTLSPNRSYSSLYNTQQIFTVILFLNFWRILHMKFV